MDDQANVWLVDAHAERDRGDDDGDVVTDEPLLSQASFVGIQPGVIRLGGKPCLRQSCGEILRVLSREAIYDRGLFLVLGEQSDECGIGVALRLDEVGQVLAVEAGDEAFGVRDVQLIEDVFSDALGCGRSEGDTGNVGEFPADGVELPVVRAKVVPPFGDAVRLVHRDEADGQCVEENAETGERQTLRRDIEYLRAPPQRGLVDRRVLVLRQTAIDECGWDTIRG